MWHGEGLLGGKGGSDEAKAAKKMVADLSIDPFGVFSIMMGKGSDQKLLLVHPCGSQAVCMHVHCCLHIHSHCAVCLTLT